MNEIKVKRGGGTCIHVHICVQVNQFVIDDVLVWEICNVGVAMLSILS